MKEKYTGYSSFIMTASILVGYAPLPLLVLHEITKGTVFVLILLPMFLCIAGIILACYTPCRCEAGDKGFMISVLGFKWEYRYSELEHIGYEYVNTRDGGMIKLTVRDNISETVFREKCRADDMTALLNDPGCERKPHLVRLCEYIKEMTGEKVCTAVITEG